MLAQCFYAVGEKVRSVQTTHSFFIISCVPDTDRRPVTDFPVVQTGVYTVNKAVQHGTFLCGTSGNCFFFSNSQCISIATAIPVLLKGEGLLQKK